MKTTVTKKQKQEEWKKSIKSAMVESVKESVEVGKEEEEIKDASDIHLLSGSGVSNLVVGTSGPHSANQLITLQDTFSNCTTSSYTHANIEQGQATINTEMTYEWEPKPDITTFELAMATPYIIRHKVFYEGDPELLQPFARHFNFDND